MKKLLTVIFIGCLSGLLNAEIKTYDVSEALPLYKQRFSLACGDAPIPVYQIKVRPEAARQHGREGAAKDSKLGVSYAGMSYLDTDFSSPLVFTLELKDSQLNQVEILPARHVRSGAVKLLSTDLVKKTCTFQVSKPVNLTLLFNKSILFPLHLFISPIDRDPMDAKGKGVCLFTPQDPLPQDRNNFKKWYFAPGIIESNKKVDGTYAIVPPSGTEIYVAGDSYVRAKINIENKQNIVIRGRGIFSGDYDHKGEGKASGGVAKFVLLENAKNIKISGLTFLDNLGWNLNITKSQDVEIHNTKVIGYRRNTDGIDPNGSENVKISDCFIRNWDDGVCIKNNFPGYHCRNVLVDNVSVWSDFAGGGFKIGNNETRGESISHITFSNCDIQYNDSLNAGASLTLQIKNGAKTFDVKFVDIDVRHYYSTFVTQVMYHNTPTTVKDILLKNINVEMMVEKTPIKNRVTGMDDAHPIENVVYENFVINGKKVMDPKQGNFELKFGKGVQFK